MLEFLAPDVPRSPARRSVPAAGIKQSLLARIARRLLFRMDVGTADKPAILYLSSVDLVPMGSWMVVTESGAETPLQSTTTR